MKDATELGLNAGALVAVPIPEAEEAKDIENAI
jgi:hypothetical protein